MVAMGVQRQHHGRAFLHEAHPGMTAAMDATLVALGQTKPALQIQIVARRIAATSTGEQSIKPFAFRATAVAASAQ